MTLLAYLGRKTLGSGTPPEIQLLTVNGNVAFRDGASQTAYSDIAVFDGTYANGLGLVTNTIEKRLTIIFEKLGVEKRTTVAPSVREFFPEE